MHFKYFTMITSNVIYMKWCLYIRTEIYVTCTLHYYCLLDKTTFRTKQKHAVRGILFNPESLLKLDCEQHTCKSSLKKMKSYITLRCFILRWYGAVPLTAEKNRVRNVFVHTSFGRIIIFELRAGQHIWPEIENNQSKGIELFCRL